MCWKVKFKYDWMQESISIRLVERVLRDREVNVAKAIGSIGI